MGKRTLVIAVAGAAVLAVIIAAILSGAVGPDMRLPYGIESDMTFDEIDACMHENGFRCSSAYDILRFYSGGEVFGYSPEKTMVQYFDAPVSITIGHNLPDDGLPADDPASVYYAVEQAAIAEYGQPDSHDGDGSPRWRDGRYELHISRGDDEISVTYIYRQ